MSEITRYPLVWPNNVPRTAPQNSTWPKFDERTVSSAKIMVLQEVNRLNKRRWDYNDESVIISSNIVVNKDGSISGSAPAPRDTAVAVYFTLRFARNGKWYERPCVLSCDKWNKVAFNLTAIAKDIEAQRARERWGCTTVEQAFQGYLAIPEKCGGQAWWVVLGIVSTANAEQVKAAYKSKANIVHPDKPGGSEASFKELTVAYDQAMAQFRS